MVVPRFTTRERVRRRVSYHITIVPPNANYGHSLVSLNFGIQENIDAFPVGTHPLAPMK